MSQKNVSRRQFVKRAAVGAAAIAATATVARSAKGCPLVFDADGNRVEYWCIVHVDDSEPFFTVYTWENCATGEQRVSLGLPGETLGDCTNAANDPSCMTTAEIGHWKPKELNGKQFLFDPEMSDAATRRIIQSFVK